MSSDAGTRGCEEHANELAELALGVLDGRARAAALSHVESCPRCADELELLSRVADTVVQAAPEMEPPEGFEARVLEHMGVVASSDDTMHAPIAEPAGIRPRRHARLARWVPASVAAAVVVLAVGLGVFLSSGSGPTGGGSTQHQVVSVALVAKGQPIGRVRMGGTRPWMSMTLRDAPLSGTVNCVVVTDDGVVHRVGTFVAHAGYGAWVSPLPVKPSEVHLVEAVAPTGSVLATATVG